MSKKADERKYYLEHLLRLEQYSGRLTRIYKSYIDEFIEISKTVKIDPDKPFSFSDYPQTLERVNKTLSSIADNVKIFFDQATRDEWIESNIKSDALIGTILKNTKIPKSQLEQFYNRNLSALERFQQRKIDGMDLSDRIWRNTEQFKSQIEFGIDTAIGEGRSAAQLARDVKGYLQDPDKLFRRVRNRRGNLVLSKQAEAFNPGRGRYRSSYKNSERLARTEINMSYREADINRYQSLPFVVGYEIRRSNNPFDCIECESLVGKYPKWFKFNGWHPNCRCSIISILATEEERDKIQEMILNGEDLSTFHSVNEVKDVPEAFKKYVYDNLDTFEWRKSTPYWIRDNFKDGNPSQGLKFGELRPIIPKKTSDPIKPIATPAPPKVSRIPKELSKDSEYLKGSKIKFKDEFFNLVDPASPIGLTMSKRGGSYYSPAKKSIQIENGSRVANSNWHKESVIYHEYGHAIDWQRGLRTQNDISELMDKYRKILSQRETKTIWTRDYDYKEHKYINIKKETKISGYAYVDEKLKELNSRIWKMDNSIFEKRGISKMDVLEQIGSTRDTIMSLNRSYGYGHTKAYFKDPDKQKAEFIAHAFENKFAGNTVFKKYLPDLYNDMIKYIEELKGY